MWAKVTFVTVLLVQEDYFRETWDNFRDGFWHSSKFNFRDSFKPSQKQQFRWGLLTPTKQFPDIFSWYMTVTKNQSIIWGTNSLRENISCGLAPTKRKFPWRQYRVSLCVMAYRRESFSWRFLLFSCGFLAPTEIPLYGSEQRMYIHEWRHLHVARAKSLTIRWLQTTSGNKTINFYEPNQLSHFHEILNNLVDMLYMTVS